MTYSKLQTYLNDYFAKHKTEASMFDATYYLYNQKDFSYKPAKLKWQEEKFSNLSDLYQVWILYTSDAADDTRFVDLG
ncbi:MAG: hypothetical protein K2O75_00830, partial [Lactobacillus sp.]|uniref:hypothetical protein n=1 Tax=Lactobacillus sp. TaxID=1591 RepID=UPI0023C29191